MPRWGGGETGALAAGADRHYVGSRVEGTRIQTAFVAVALAVFGVAPARAATITPSPTAPDGAADGQCSLREAIQAANTNLPVDSCAPGQSSVVDVVSLPAGTYMLTGAANEDNNASGDLDLEEGVQITGAGSGSTTIDANGVDRAIDIDPSAFATISGVTIRNGALPPGPAAGISDAQQGGGIRAFGPLTLQNATITSNTAGSGGDASINTTSAGGGGGRGGGIYGIAPLNITNSVISDNFAGAGGNGGYPGNPIAGTFGGTGGAGGSGGGIYCDVCIAVTISGSTISGNRAGQGGSGGFADTPGNGGGGGEGGGVFGKGVLLQSSAVTDNRAGAGGVAGGDPSGNNTAASGFGGQGGGLALFGDNATITNSTITLNRSGAGGSAAFGAPAGSANTSIAGSGGDGGGLYVAIDNLASIAGTTIADNQTGGGGNSARGIAGSGGRGGGIALTSGTQQASATLRTSTISGNLTGNGGNSSGTTANNFPGNGGAGAGAYVFGGFVPLNATIENSTVTANTTGSGGTSGFLQNGGTGGQAAGLHIGPQASANLTHLTIAANATGNGGMGTVGPGARPDGGGLFMTSNGGASTVSVRNTILASNLPANCLAESSPTVTDLGGHVIFGVQCPTLLNGLTSDPLLGALADNGGPTQTMALPEGSPALDVIAASGAGCLSTDQRGTSRPQGSACDAGAFERTVPVPDTGGGAGDDGGGGGGTTTEPPPGSTEPPPGSTAPTSQTPGGGATPDRTAPTVVLRLVRQRLLRALRRGYRARFTTNELGIAVVELFASGRTARGAATRKRVARGTLTITRTGTRTAVAKFTRRARRAFAKRRRVPLTLRLTVRDAAGNRTVKTAKLVLRR